jgi:AraC-like DNA-binding protein
MPKYFEQYNRSEVTRTKRIINTPNDFARRNLFYVQEAGTLKSLKPHESHRKSLDSYLFIAVLSGEGQVRVAAQSDNGSPLQEYTVLPHQCILLDCHNEYSHISSEDKPWELMWVHFNGPLASHYHKLFSQRSTPVFNVSDFSQAVSTINRIMEVHEHHKADTDIISSMLITCLLTQAITESGNGTTSLARKLPEVLSYIDDHFRSPLSLDELSSTFFISKYYLARAFREQYQVTIVQYILTKRINYAKELLRYTDESIESIARKCGIGDASYFNKVFKKLEGMTAGQYRRQW